MAYTIAWNSAFEALPPDSGENASQGASRMRDHKNAIRERMEKDHYFDEVGTDADHGEHAKITFHAPILTPSNVSNKAFLYTKDVGGKPCLHFEDEDGNEVKMTTAIVAGGLHALQSFPTGTKMVFYQSTAPLGWTTDGTLNGRILRIDSASGGTNAGSYDISTHLHAHTMAHTHTMGTHNHQWYNYNSNSTPAQLYNSAGTLTTFTPGTVYSVWHIACWDGTNNALKVDGYTNKVDPGDTSGSSVASTGATNIAPYYVDVILCAMN